MVVGTGLSRAAPGQSGARGSMRSFSRRTLVNKLLPLARVNGCEIDR